MEWAPNIFAAYHNSRLELSWPIYERIEIYSEEENWTYDPTRPVAGFLLTPEREEDVYSVVRCHHIVVEGGQVQAPCPSICYIVSCWLLWVFGAFHRSCMSRRIATSCIIITRDTFFPVIEIAIISDPLGRHCFLNIEWMKKRIMVMITYLMQMDSKQLVMLLLWGWCLWSNQAIRCSNRVNTRYHISYSNRSSAHMKASNVSKAPKDAEDCISLMPNFVKGFSHLGAAQQVLHRYEQAIMSFKKGLKIDPNNQGLLNARKSCEEV